MEESAETDISGIGIFKTKCRVRGASLVGEDGAGSVTDGAAVLPAQAANSKEIKIKIKISWRFFIYTISFPK